jgi:hypothetical protein
MSDPNPTPTPNPETGAPVTPPPAAIDPGELTKRDAEIATLRTHKIKVDRDNENLRKANKETAEKNEALRKLAGITDDKEDPAEKLRKQSEATREAETRGYQTQIAVSTALARAGLLPKDNDPDYLHFKLNRDPELQDLAADGKLDDLVAKLKEKGLAVTPAVAAASPPANPNMPSFAAPKPGAVAMDAEAEKVKDWKTLVSKGSKFQAEFTKKYPDRATALKAQFDAQYRRST